MKFKNKVVVVTGGTRGIGKAIVEEFAAQGAHVLFTYTSSAEAATEIAQRLTKKNQTISGQKIDVCDFVAVNKWREGIIAKYKKIDVLVNNAGITRDKALMMMTPEDWHAVIDTNLTGVFNTTRAFITTFMKQKEGQIVNVTSVSGIVGLPRQINYASSKGGVISFTRSLAREVAPYNIRVNAVAPGFIETDMLKSLNEKYMATMLTQIPLNRLGQPQEVAKSVMFLAGKDAGYITGQILRIDGGM